MLTLNEIRERLKDRNLAHVARELGRTRQQLWQLANGENSNPTYKLLKQVSDYLEGK